MKTRIFILTGVIGLILLIGCYRAFNLPTILNDQPKRPDNLPNEAFWSGGMDGGAWFVINPQKVAPDIWQIKIYSDDGQPWVRGNFWWKSAKNIKTSLPISGFDGHIILLESNEEMLPVGEHFYPQKGQDTKVIIYPTPSPEYTELKQLGERVDKPESW
jgi:hypothetical protein